MSSENGHGLKSERVGLYGRVSFEEQKTKETIETQDGFLEEYCRLYRHEIAKVYKDEAAPAPWLWARGRQGVSFWRMLMPECSMWC